MKNTAKNILLALLLLVVTVPVAQAARKENYRFVLTIDGNKDSVIMLGHYYASGNRVIDTARRDNRGRFVFSGNEILKPGMYFFVNEKGNYVEFVVYNESPFFTFHTEQDDWTLRMKVEGSRQNTLMFNYQRMLERIYSDIESQKATMDSAQLASFAPRAVAIIDSARLDFVNTYPNSMVARVMKATLPPEVPVADPDGTPWSREQRREYYLDHYFDNIPLDDEMIIRTPKNVFYQRVMDYIDNALKYAMPDEVERHLDTILNRATPDGDVYQWLLLTFAQKYLQSNVMSYDQVYVHLILKYYANAEWASPSSVEQEVDRATKWERLLIGKEAPELMMYDTLRYLHSLHRMPADYKLLIFWSPSCGHCKEIIPQVYEKFVEYSQTVSIGAYAVLTEPDTNSVKQWKKFIKEHGIDNTRWINLNGGEANIDWRDVYDVQTTPQIYLLNAENEIIAKKLDAHLFELVMQSVTKEDNTTKQ
ncbi:MAG: DUF5106 domain-containing protein [Bacteroidales bacterium]|nr:DUF5106 domain-containing protein [Bacteroidales bacterium]